MKRPAVKIGVICTVTVLAMFLVLPCFFGNVHGKGIHAARTRTQLAAIATVLTEFKRRHHRYPTEQEGIEQAATAIRSLPMDAWGNPLVYRLDSDGSPKVYSLGVNQRDEYGEGDDIRMETLSH